jgi:hypothetical protein
MNPEFGFIVLLMLVAAKAISVLLRVINGENVKSAFCPRRGERTLIWLVPASSLAFVAKDTGKFEDWFLAVSYVTYAAWVAFEDIRQRPVHRPTPTPDDNPEAN